MEEQPLLEQQPIATGQAIPPTVAIGQPVGSSQGLQVLPIGQAAAAPHPHVAAPAAVVEGAVHHQGASTMLHPHQIHTANLLVGTAETVSSLPLMRVQRPAMSQGLPCPSVQTLPTQLAPFGTPPPPVGCSFDNVIIPNVAAKSVVWRYFGFPPKDGTVDVADRNFTRCRLCKGQIPYKGQTTNMLKHLESKHKEEYEEVKCKIGTNPKVGRIGHVNFVGASRGDSRKRLRKLDPDAAEALVKTEALPAMSMAMEMEPQGPLVGIIMGSDSDLPTMRPAAETLEKFGVAAEVTVVSAHRTPERMMEYAKTAHKRGIRVIIAGAGGAAHLPGMVAALTPLPVIGVPAVPNGSHLDGLDALMSIVQMPRGVPVATVAIGNSTNAGLLALRILGTGNPVLMDAMLQYQDVMRQTVMEKVDKLDSQGWKNYQ